MIHGSSFTDIIFIFVLVTVSFLTLNSIYNLLTAPRLRKNLCLPDAEEKHISILIPARNEENNIAACLDSVLAQEYVNYGIIVLNDQSGDKTGEILKGYAAANQIVKIINGKSLPPDWLGKNWACHQLSQSSDGDYFVFMDADVTLHPMTLKTVNRMISKYKTDMFSVFPAQVFSSFGDKFVVPLMNWLLLSFLPLFFVYLSRNKSFIAANGQFICISKEVYWKNGGHEALKDRVVEDMEMARKVKTSGGTVMTALGYDMISCKMYSSFADSFRGFSKNFYPGFNISVLSFLVMILFFETVFLLPFILVFIKPAFLWIIFLILFIRFSVAYLSKTDILTDIILHPFQMIVLIAVGINSIYSTKKKKNVWKGRNF